MPYSDITENILKQMRTAGEPKTTTQTATPADPGFGGSQMGALLGMIIGQLIGGKGAKTDTSLTDYLAGSGNPYGLQGLPSTPVVQPMAASADPADQLSADEFAILAAKTPQELMAIYNYAKKMQAQESGGILA